MKVYENKMAQRETRCLRALDTTEGVKFGVGVVFNEEFMADGILGLNSFVAC